MVASKNELVGKSLRAERSDAEPPLRSTLQYTRPLSHGDTDVSSGTLHFAALGKLVQREKAVGLDRAETADDVAGDAGLQIATPIDYAMAFIDANAVGAQTIHSA